MTPDFAVFVGGLKNAIPAIVACYRSDAVKKEKRFNCMQRCIERNSDDPIGVSVWNGAYKKPIMLPLPLMG
jgi:hypothetical protein